MADDRKVVDVRSPLYHACGATLYRILPETESDQVQVSGTGQTLSETLSSIDRALGGNTSMRFCPNIASRNQLAGILPGDRVYVLDASADPDVGVDGRPAMYIFLPTMEWQLIGENAPQDMRDYVEEGKGLTVNSMGRLELSVQASDGEGGGLTTGEDGNLEIALAPNSGLTLKDGALTMLCPMWNTVETITETGQWTSPVTGWVEVMVIDGGDGGYCCRRNVWTGGPGACSRNFVWLNRGQKVDIVIGAGGKGQDRRNDSLYNSSYGTLAKASPTSFGEITSQTGKDRWRAAGRFTQAPGDAHCNIDSYAILAGETGYGAGGRGGWAGTATPTGAHAYDGGAGAVIVKYYDPALASGPATQTPEED